MFYFNKYFIKRKKLQSVLKKWVNVDKIFTTETNENLQTYIINKVYKNHFSIKIFNKNEIKEKEIRNRI